MNELPLDCVLPRTRGENANCIVEQVRALGLDPQPTSRLMRMYEVLNSGLIPFDDPRFPTALEAERDLQQLGFVFDQLQTHHDNDEFKALVKKTLKDSTLPQDDRGADRRSEFSISSLLSCGVSERWA